jgi:hypothetical protein
MMLLKMVFANLGELYVIGGDSSRKMCGDKFDRLCGKT